MLHNEDVSSSSEAKKKERPRPKSLNLKDTKNSNSDLALRIVSPGLPPLNKEMQSTVVISQKIQQQQKNLIAARHGKNVRSAEEEEEEDISRNDSESENSDTEPLRGSVKSSSSFEMSKSTGYNNKSRDGNTAETSGKEDFDEMDSKSASMSPKRLKREKIPSRLNISLSGNMGSTGYSSTPLIQSAPIRALNKFPIPVNMNPHARRRYVSTPQYQITPNQQSSPYVMPMQRRQYVLVPLSQTYSPVLSTHEETKYEDERVSLPVIANNGKHQALKTHSKLDTKVAKGKQITVTDVYQGDYTKIAPLTSQPLSAQKDYFDKNSRLIDEDRSPVTDSEVKEMQEKYKGDAVNEHYVKTPVNDSNEIFGSINIMNENFNFRIFNQSGDEEESKLESGMDDFVKEKKKFMKVCERTWDEFINNRRSNSS